MIVTKKEIHTRYRMGYKYGMGRFYTRRLIDSHESLRRERDELLRQRVILMDNCCLRMLDRPCNIDTCPLLKKG